MTRRVGRFNKPNRTWWCVFGRHRPGRWEACGWRYRYETTCQDCGERIYLFDTDPELERHVREETHRGAQRIVDLFHSHMNGQKEKEPARLRVVKGTKEPTE